MKIISLQSGSNGNSLYVEGGGVRLLVDAGISGQQAELRLAAHGRDIRRVDALLISHDHRDHARSMGIFQRKFGMTICVTSATLAAAAAYQKLGRLQDLHHFQAGDTLGIGGLRVTTVPTPHDGADGVAFVIDDGRRRVGILTDLGHPFAGLAEVVATLDAVVLESNHDPALLDQGPYPEFLKHRIRGPHGHLSNAEAAELLAAAPPGRLQWACLAHLSEENNDPTLAVRTHRERLGRHLPLFVASRYGASDVLEVA